MKKVVAAFLSIFMLIGAVGCGSKEESPEEVVKITFDALKEGDYVKASKYIDYDELMKSAEDISQEEEVDLSKEELQQAEEYAALLFKNLDYKILSSEEKDGSAVVKAEITNIDMAVVLGEVFLKAFQLAFSGIGEEEINEKVMEAFKESLTKEDIKLTTSTVDIKLEKEDKTWKINTNDTLTDGMFGGLLSAVKDLEKGF